MSRNTVHIYVNPEADLDRYPDNLYGDMSVFKGTRSIQHEVQWVFYLMLRDQGLDVQICREYPKEGILLIHKSIARNFVWRPNLFVVSLQWDYPRDQRAQLHLVSNNYKTAHTSLGLLDRLSFPGLQYYRPPIMHPIITPRRPELGDRFEKIAFIGDPKNLDDAFKTDVFLDQVKALGMEFTVIADPEKLSDFSDVDVVVAIRKLGVVINNKPSVKLINAWRGGVPSILGCEIGYREARENEYDYIEVDSVEETVNALKKLKDDLEFRHRMLANGKKRCAQFTAEGQQEIWVKFFKEVVLPANEVWQKKSIMGKSIFLSFRCVRCVVREGMSYVWHRLFKRNYSDYT